MPAQDPPVVRVRTAGRPGSPNGPSQDRVFVVPNAVVLLDGASQPVPEEHDGGWLADTLGATLAARLAATPGQVDLRVVLARAIAEVTARHARAPGTGPSSTVSIIRWHADTIDVLVLGDSPVIAMTWTGELRQVRDDRLARVAQAERRAFRAGPGQFGVERPRQWHALLDAQRQWRNRPGGYWIAEADPTAAAYARRARWRTRDIAAILAVTDGIADGVDRYRTPADWPAALDLAAHHPTGLIELVHHTELGDPHGTRWPRSKRHDDKTVALIEFC